MPEIPTNYQRLEGSERQPARGARRVGPADPKETLSVSIRVRRRPDAPAMPDSAAMAAIQRGQRRFLSREDFATRYGASDADFDRVTKFADSRGLKVVERSIPRRTIVVSGTVEQMSRAFAVELSSYESPSGRYRGREGHLHLPSDLAEVVEGVLGLDDRKMAQALYKMSAGPVQATTGLTPPQVAKLYDFPTTPSAVGQTIGLLEFGGGYQVSDITAFYKELGLANPSLTAVGVDGVSNSPGVDFFSDVEVALDIDVCGSVGLVRRPPPSRTPSSPEQISQPQTTLMNWRCE